MKIASLFEVAALLLLFPACCCAYNATLGWQTLQKVQPLVIANGGTSGLYPGQTDQAYADAASTTAFPTAFLCDLQLTKDNFGICRTGWNLSQSTNLTNILTNTSTMGTYVIQGVSETGYFSVDFNLTELNQTTAIQPNPARSSAYDGLFPIVTPEHVAAAVFPGGGLYFWLNVEYPTFYQEHPGKNSLASYLTTFLNAYNPLYLSATEVGILKLLQPTAKKSLTSLVLKFLDINMVEESTNSTYGAVLSNLTDIATYAGGILVPKNYIYNTKQTSQTNSSDYGDYVDSASTLVRDAHKAGLQVFVYGFANDAFPSAYNYSFDPVLEELSYIGNSFQIDGFLTDFPTTAAEAINCYPDGYVKAPLASRATSKAVQSPLIISHNGASGDFPGCTMLAYVAAINDGADYVDCTVQITSDGVPFCREDVDLLKSTNVVSNPALYQQYVTSYPELQAELGVFSFNLTWSNVSTLKAKMFNPWDKYSIRRDPSNDNVQNILTLDEFLSFAKNNSGIGIYVKLQHAYYLRTVHDLDLVDAVVTSLTKANLTDANDKVFVATEDSSALAALQNLMPSVKMVYVIPYDKPISVTGPVLQEIKQYTSIVAINRQLIDPIGPDGYTLATKTSVASSAHALNMTVFYSFLSNEFVAYAADYRSDPTLQINSLLQEYKVDGFLTDFPSTLYNFLHKNYCYQLLGGHKHLSNSTLQYPILPVAPANGSLAVAPSPSLPVAEPPVSYPVPESSPGPNGTSTGPAPPPSSATTYSASLVATTFALLLIFAFIF